MLLLTRAKRDPAGVRKIADHLGSRLMRRYRGREAEPFDAMARKPQGPRPGDARNAKYATPRTASSTPRARVAPRQGGAGTWVQHFSSLLSVPLHAAYQSTMGVAAAAGGASVGVRLRAGVM